MWEEHELARYRRAELLEEAEMRRLARLARRASRRPSLRARAAGTLLGAAFALEREATWRAVWDRMVGANEVEDHARWGEAPP
jgi:hypothetical protein